MNADEEQKALALGARYDALARRRHILLVAHVAFGLAAGFVLMSQQSFVKYAYWRRTGHWALMCHLFASWPYVVSGIKCHLGRVDTTFALVVVVLTRAAGTAAAIALHLGVGEFHAQGIEVLVVTVAQLILFLAVARAFIRPSTD